MRLGLPLLVSGAIAVFALPAMAAPSPGTVEVLDRAADGTPTLARVVLPHDLPDWIEQRMGLGGTWSYLMRDGQGVAVFDVGPRYPLIWSFVSCAWLKVGLRPLAGEADLFAALDRVFPGRPVSEVVLSHWHADHTEDAPSFQAACLRRWGVRPPLRIMAIDRARRSNAVSGLGRFLPAGAEAVFQAAGYHRGDWHWGPDLTDGAVIGQTGFRVLAMPGHTLGTIALIDPVRRISLGPSLEAARSDGWIEDTPGYWASRASWLVLTAGYRVYSTHPGRPGHVPSG